MLTNSSYRLLKKIRNPNYSESTLSPKYVTTYEKDIDMLTDKNFITYDITGYRKAASDYFMPEYSEYKITNEGIAYIQNKRKEILLRWIPYTITTIIAIAALVNSVFARLGL